MNRFENHNTTFFGLEAREKMIKGIDKVSDAVKVTMGAKGRIVIIDKPMPYVPHATTDGVTVATSIMLEDHAESMGARLIQDAAARTAYKVGDGTSGCTVLTQSIIHKGIKNVTAGASPVNLKNGIDKAVKMVLSKLSEIAIPCNTEKELINIATVSAHNDKPMGEVVGMARFAAGLDGSIDVLNSKDSETYYELTDGYKFEGGWLSYYFVNNDRKSTVEYNDPLIFLVDDMLTSNSQVAKIIKEANTADEGRERPLIIIANDILDGAFSYMAMTSQKFKRPIAGVRAPMTGANRTNSLEDMAIYLNGTVVSEKKGMRVDDCGIEYCGSCEKIIITGDSTTFTGGYGDPKKVKDRIKSLEDQKKELQPNNQSVHTRRIARLASVVANIYVGAASETELRERKDRIDDALRSTHAAMEEGIVVGGGVALVKASKILVGVKGNNDEETTGINIIREAIYDPMMQIAKNANASGEVVVNDVLKNKNDHIGFNALTGEYEDLMKAGIIDPVKVIRVALENAASVGGLFLMTECILVDNPKKDEA